MRRSGALLVLSSFLLPLVSCDRLKGETKHENTAAAGASAAGASASAEAKQGGEPPNPNDAFFIGPEGKEDSLYRIRAGAVKKIAPGECSELDDLAIDKEGRAWVRCRGKVFKSEGDALVRAGTLESAVVLAVGRDGSIWVGTSTPPALHMLEKDGWKEIQAPDGLGSTWNLAVDDKGKPWVSTQGAIWVRVGDAWQPAPLGNEKPEVSLVAKVVPTDDGTVFVLTDEKIFVGIEDGKPGSRTFPNHREPIARPGGGLIVADSSAHGGTIVLYDAKGTQDRSITPADKVFFRAYGDESGRITADRKGRVWIGTPYGLVVADADGSLQQLEPGRVPGLAAAGVRRVVVAGDGPELPKLGEKVRGSVKGKINVDEPTQVELCAGPFFTYRDDKVHGPAPCAGVPIVRAIKTDKDGKFELADVPPYPMTLLIKTNARSWVRRDPKCCEELEAGEVKDIGTFEP